MCSVKFGDCGSMSHPYSFEFPCQLKNWLRVQGVALKLYCFGQQVPLCSTKFQPQDCLSLLNFLLLDATGYVDWAWFNTQPAIGFHQSYRHPRTLRCNRTRCGGGFCGISTGINELNGRRPCCKCRNWNCAPILLVISSERGGPCPYRLSSFSL